MLDHLDYQETVNSLYHDGENFTTVVFVVADVATHIMCAGSVHNFILLPSGSKTF